MRCPGWIRRREERKQEAGMQVNILCAVRDRRMAQDLDMEIADGEHCIFRIVTNGQDALAMSREFAPDILIVDAVLPGIDGLGVIDRMKEMLGDRMPRVIGGSMMHFADEGFCRRGILSVVGMPWSREEIRSAVLLQMEDFQKGFAFEDARRACLRAMAILSEMGMPSKLKGYEYLAWAAAMTYENEARLESVRESLYRPIAKEFGTTHQNVERLIRHAVERTMDGKRAKGVYGFFGNTIDPTRGKPTNAQCIGEIAQRLRVQ